MGRKRITWAMFLGGSLLFLPCETFAEKESSSKATPGTEIIDIQTDSLPPASAEEIVPRHPFFSEPTTGNEVFEEVEELKERVRTLEENMVGSHIQTKPDGTLVIDSDGPIIIRSRENIKIIAKSVEMPPKPKK